jgi:uncharacterized protein (TIGR03067 family)
VRFLSLTVVLVAFAAGTGADGKARAPVPKPQDAPALDGSYTVNYTSAVTTVGWGGPGGPGRVPVTQITLRSSTATIAKGEIVIGANYDGWGGYGPGGFDPRGNTGQSMTYSLDPTKTPMTIDLTTVDARNKKTKSLGIIEVDDERITIAVAKPGAERPKNTEENDEITVYYFKKAPPPPKVEFRIIALTVGKEAEVEKELTKLAKEGFELVNTTNPAAADPKAAPTTVHFILKRTSK